MPLTNTEVDAAMPVAGTPSRALTNAALKELAADVATNAAAIAAIDVPATVMTGMMASGTALPTAADTTLSSFSKLLGWAGNLAANVRGVLLTGWVEGANTAVLATDSITAAIGKLQGQLTAAASSLSGKQATLVSGTNIKTINGASVLGSGDITISGGGGGGTVDSVPTDGSTNAVSSDGVFDALAGKANKASDTLTNATLAGVTLSGKTVLTISNMGDGTAIDTSGMQTKTISADTPLSYASTPAVANTVAYLALVNDSATARTITIPSTYSEDQQKTITSFVLPGNAQVRMYLTYTGSGYSIKGEPWPLQPKSVVVFIPAGGGVTLTIWDFPWTGTVRKIVTRADADSTGSCTFSMFINDVALGAAPNTVSTTKQTQSTTSANRTAEGDKAHFVISANAGTLGGTATIYVDSDAP